MTFKYRDFKKTDMNSNYTLLFIVSKITFRKILKPLFDSLTSQFEKKDNFNCRFAKNMDMNFISWSKLNPFLEFDQAKILAMAYRIQKVLLKFAKNQILELHMFRYY